MLALAALTWAVLGMAFACFLPATHAPEFLRSFKAGHFVGFYSFALLSLAALPFLKLGRVITVLTGVAVALEVLRYDSHPGQFIAYLFCDVSGIVAVLAPVFIGGLRQSFALGRDDDASMSVWR